MIVFLSTSKVTYGREYYTGASSKTYTLFGIKAFTSFEYDEISRFIIDDLKVHPVPKIISGPDTTFLGFTTMSSIYGRSDNYDAIQVCWSYYKIENNANRTLIKDAFIMAMMADPKDKCNITIASLVKNSHLVTPDYLISVEMFAPSYKDWINKVR